MLRRGRLPLAATLVVAATGAGGLGLAQNQTSNAVAPGPAAPSAPPVPISQIGPPVAVIAVPPPEPSPPPPPEADNADSDDANTAENALAPTEPPPAPKRPRYATAVLQALDKVTAETLRFEAKVNEPVRYKDLVITVHACETSASDETFPESAAHLDIQYQPDLLPGAKGAMARRIYQGWMFAQSPGLHPLQHPIYDVWVIACRAPSPAAPPAAGASL